MTRFNSVILAAVISQWLFCEAVFADPDISVVRAVIEQDTAQVTVSGRTRVALVAAVVHGLEDCQVPADGLTVGPWLRLPKNTETDKRLVITLCVGGSLEGGDSTAYIGVTPKAPFKIIAAITNKLRNLGLTDVRLLSDETVLDEITPTVNASDRDSNTVSPHE